MTTQARCALESHTDHLDEARKDCEQALAIVRDALGPDHPLVAEAETNLGIVSADRHDFADAKRLWVSALDRLDRGGGDDRLGVATVLLDLGEISIDTGDLPAAKAYLDRLRTVTASAATSPQYLDVGITLAHLLRATESPAAEIKAMEDLQRRANATLGLVSRTTAHASEDLAIAYENAGRLPEARAMFENAVASARALYGLRHRTTLGVEGRYAQTLLELHQAKEAQPLLEQIVAIVDEDLPGDTTFRAEAYTNLADCMLQLGDLTRSLDLAKRGLAIREQRNDDPLQTSEVRFILAKAMWRAHDPKAIAVAEKSAAEMKAIGPRATTLPEVEAFLTQARGH
jgi:tetratricopeptide (TPR) repeat protein